MNKDLSRYAPDTEVAKATEALCQTIADRATLDSKIAEMPGTIETITAAIATAAADLARVEGDLALADEGTAQYKALVKQLKELNEIHGAEHQRLRSGTIRIAGLEAKAAQVDEQVRAATTDLNILVTAYFDAAKTVLSAEFAEAVKPIIGVLAKANGMGVALRDTVRGAFIPDPVGFNLLGGVGLRCGIDYYGANLLEQAPSAEQVAEAEAVRRLIAPALAALARGRSHVEYVPLAKRPKPASRRGYTHGGVKADARPFGAVEQAPPPAPKPAFTAKVRLGLAGQPAPGTPVEGGVGFEEANVSRSEFGV
jgi:hypothetical protein